MNAATFQIPSSDKRPVVRPASAWHRWARASSILVMATLALGACAGANDEATDEATAEFELGEHEQALTTGRTALTAAASAPPPVETSSKAAIDDVTELDNQIFDSEIEAMSSARAIGGGTVGGGFGSLNAWGCWDSECCTCTMRECWPTGDGRLHCVCKQSTCSPCERCIWPY
jgi:hypothetical protein